MASLTIQFEGEAARIVPLSEPVTTIGRSVDNVLEVPDPNMSRRHLVVEQRENGEYVLTDCNSSNGTKLNGERVISQELRDGDRIECGQTTIVFNFEDGSGAQNPGLRRAPVEESFDETARPDEMRAPLAPPPSSEEGLGKSSGSMPKLSRTPKSEPEVAVLAHERDDLRKLLEINKRLNQQHDLRALLQTIIDSAIELMAAERGFLILVDKGEMKVEIARNMSREVIVDGAPTQVSTQICREVIETGRAVLTTNAAADQRYGRYQSVVGLKLRSILCVPFKIKDAVLGTVYLDNANVGAFSERDVDLLSAFSDQAAVAIENSRLLRQARKKERMDQELRIASQIQRKLLPRSRPRVKGLEVYGWMHPAKEVGGDYYDWIPVDDALLICIGDVSGKGVPAGLVMASARSALRSLADKVRSTRDIVVSLNRLLADDLEREMFISLLLMRYEPDTGRLTYTGAGHEHILIWRARERRIETRKTGGMVLGLSQALEEFAKEDTLDLAIGDAVILYTDGVTEAVNGANEQYQLERLQASSARHGDKNAREMLQAVLRDVLAWKGRASQRDDITLLTIKRTDPSAPEDKEEPSTSRHPGSSSSTAGSDLQPSPWSGE